MTSKEILNELRSRMPYWWRVHLRDGRTFDIRYPGLLLVTKPLLISERDPDDEGDDWPIAGKSHFIPADDVVRLEPLGPTAPTKKGVDRHGAN